MGHEKAVAAHPDRQRHVVLFTDNESLHNIVEQILLVFGMKDDHAAVQQIRHLNIVRLNGQRSVNHPASKHGHGGKAVARPGGNGFKPSQRTRSGRGSEAPHTGTGAPGNRRHDAVFLFTPIIFFDVPFSVQYPDQLHGFTLRGNRIGDGKIDVGPANGFLGGLAPRNEFPLTRRFGKHILRGNLLLPFGLLMRIFSPSLTGRCRSGTRNRVALRVGFDFRFQCFTHGFPL